MSQYVDDEIMLKRQRACAEIRKKQTREDAVKLGVVPVEEQKLRLVEGAQCALHFALNEAEDDEKALEMANAALDFLNDYLKPEGAA